MSQLFDGYEVVTWRGVRVALNPGEAHGHHVYFLDGYGNAEIDACIAHSRTERVFADVGANIGFMTLTVAHACPHLSVVALEPDPVAAAWLRHNLSLNPEIADRVRLVEAAAAAEDGTVRFQPGGRADNIGLGRVVSAADHDRSTLDVRAIALGAFGARERLDFDTVKIDVEGGELEVLQGLFREVRRPKTLLIETHGGGAAIGESVFNKQIVDTLDDAGYRLLRFARRDWIPLDSASEIGARGHLLALRDSESLSTSS